MERLIKAIENSVVLPPIKLDSTLPENSYKTESPIKKLMRSKVKAILYTKRIFNTKLNNDTTAEPTAEQTENKPVADESMSTCLMRYLDDIQQIKHDLKECKSGFTTDGIYRDLNLPMSLLGKITKKTKRRWKSAPRGGKHLQTTERNQIRPPSINENIKLINLRNRDLISRLIKNNTTNSASVKQQKSQERTIYKRQAR